MLTCPKSAPAPRLATYLPRDSHHKKFSSEPLRFPHPPILPPPSHTFSLSTFLSNPCKIPPDEPCKLYRYSLPISLLSMYIRPGCPICSKLGDLSSASLTVKAHVVNYHTLFATLEVSGILTLLFHSFIPCCSCPFPLSLTHAGRMFSASRQGFKKFIRCHQPHCCFRHRDVRAWFHHVRVIHGPSDPSPRGFYPARMVRHCSPIDTNSQSNLCFIRLR